MNCGNRFVCGIKRFDKHKQAINHPTNEVLHNEGEKRLLEMIKIREEQNNGVFRPLSQMESLQLLQKQKEQQKQINN